MAMTTLKILNDAKDLSIGDEAKSESLTENLMEKTEGQWDEAERCSGIFATPSNCQRE